VSPHDWDAASYERVAADGVIALGHEVLARMPLRGDETVLDAGCGPGGITEALIDRLPQGRVIGVDASPTMVEAARKRLAAAHKDDRVRLEVADLLDLDLDERVDAVLSTATFHWISDHDRLFARLRAALRDGGRLVAQCGGEGNVAEVVAAIDGVAIEKPYARYLVDFDPWNYAGPAETEERLLRAGFHTAKCWLEERPVTPEAPIEYFATVMLGAHGERLPARRRRRFVEAVVDRLPKPVVIRYVRLNIDAVA
jgi:trans-aconitate 2-methyltransferase